VKRRLFLKSLFSVGLEAACLMSMPLGFQGCAPRLPDSTPAADSPASGLTLREIAARKLHHQGQPFTNPFDPTVHGSLWKVLSWKLFHRNDFKKHYHEEKIRPVVVDFNAVRGHQGLAVTFIKHSCLLIKDQDKYLLVDPIFRSMFRFIQDFSPLAFNPDQIPKPDHVLITHGHRDHLDIDSLAGLDRKTHLISPLGYQDEFDQLGMNNRTQLDWFESHADGNLKITLLPCHHWTMRNPLLGPNRSLWGSFLIQTATGPTIFIAGDSAYFRGYQEIGREFDVDLAVFNLGAYEPRWFMKGGHMNPEEVVRSFQELGARKLMIAHWGTFRLGDEPVHFPPLDLHREMEKQGLLDRLVQVDHGQTLFFQDGVISGPG
jgi:L-ascorbate metabolism protein UlaG (beta-lactamase superfamily)